MLHLRRLAYFTAVLDAGTLSAASLKLHIAQPALSRQIKLLEDELGLRLFERERGRLVPTPSGLEMGAIARTLLAQADLAQRAAARLRTGEVDHLVCVATPATTRGLMAWFIATTTPQDPVITTREAGHNEVEHALMEGADFVITPIPPSPGLVAVELGRFRVAAVVSLDHRWALERRGSISLAELVRERLVLPPPSSVSRLELDRCLRRAGLALGEHVVSEVDSTTIALAMSGHGVGVTTTASDNRAWWLTLDSDDPGMNGPEISLTMAWLPHHYAEPTMRSLARRFTRFIDDALATRRATPPPSDRPER